MSEQRQAGYELDVEVLTKVMGGDLAHRDFAGQDRRRVEYDGEVRFGDSAVWHIGGDPALQAARCQFSRDDAASMRVVDEMESRGWKVILYSPLRRLHSDWRVDVFRSGLHNKPIARLHPDRRVCICLAALAAVETEPYEQGGQSSGASPLACMDCGKPYRTFPLDTHLPDDLWRQIHDSEGGVLCANCIVERIAKCLPRVTVVHLAVPAAESSRMEA